MKKLSILLAAAFILNGCTAQVIEDGKNSYNNVIDEVNDAKDKVNETVKEINEAKEAIKKITE